MGALGAVPWDLAEARNEQREVSARGSNRPSGPPRGGAAESEALRGWVAREGATRTVEVGLGYGVPALHACEVLLENADPTAARHVAVEPHQAPRFSGCGLQKRVARLLRALRIPCSGSTALIAAVILTQPLASKCSIRDNSV